MTDVARSGPSPCPIPRCALEWYCALSLVALAGFVWFVPAQGGAAEVLGFGLVGRLSWSLLFAVAGLAQVAALWLRNPLAQRWTAFIGFISALVVSLTVLASLDLPLFTGLIVPLTCGEGYVFALLRGAKWAGCTTD
jgi:hypothetical protein